MPIDLSRVLDPSLAAALKPAFEGASFRFHEDGTAYADRAKDTYVVATTWLAGHQLPPELMGGHLLFFPSDVSSSEVEALAVSLWEEAGWLVPGVLGLTGEATLSGPWTLGKGQQAELNLPNSAAVVYSVQCRREREVPPPDAPVDFLDPWFKHVLPAGDEYLLVANLVTLAARLGGGLRSDMGHVAEPDPDAAVNLTVYSPNWLGGKDLLAELVPMFPGMRPFTAPIVPAEAVPGVLTGDVPLSRVAMKAIESAGIETEELNELMSQAQKYDLAALSEETNLKSTPEKPHEHEPFCLQLDLKPGAVLIEGHEAEYLPPVLRWEEWAEGPVFEYLLRWEPSDPIRGWDRRVPRALRIERVHATSTIESLAAELVAIVGGDAVDDEGFLVAFD
ncbi:hypothetical protein BK816_01745 [Boudabousia tangfeifanii]|uniref:Uncharacterized protein n=1 Tax=Boudabousia tangfeifanii TaxID=1912795 RepID=A0A1D9MIR9_9ACTO|nr:hypothetical protein [Boudabousia tangfeifanii]AOZ72176.1 hypothetical protein BK816_01745 [Boudabousia tangfeifanii]